MQRRNRLFEAILRATPDLVYVFDLDHRFVYANAALLQMWGKTWDEAIGLNCLELGYEPWHAAMHDREIEMVVATQAPIRGEVAFNGTNGRRIYDYIFVPVLDGDGHVEAVAGTTRDVTERKQQEEMQALLAAELQHRVKNTLAVVLAIARQSFAAAPSGFDQFSARVVALSNGLDILTQKHATSGSLRALIESVLAPHRSGHAGRISFAGPDFLVRSQVVVALSLALHELATNAAKYGALSTSGGSVSLTWTAHSDRFSMTWSEQGGPSVEVPQRKGFGSRLIQDNLAKELDGSVDVRYEPTGLVFELETSLHSIQDA